MLGNCEKMVLISSTSNEWSQQNNQLDDQKGGSMNMASVAAATAGVMDQKVAAVISQEHQQQQQQQQQKQQNQEAMRCPRCDSTNTKFCYYNNYSLSQPRHFCKACKRYWTRGGTLRNVPVGGGCRKNKRVRRPPNSSSSSTTSLTNNSSLEASANSASSGGISSLHSGSHIHDLISSASNHVNPLFYGLHSSHHNPSSDINFPFSRYDLQTPPHISGLGLGFSSGLVHSINEDGEYRNGMNINLHNHLSNSKHFQDLISSNPLLSNYATSTTTTSTSSPSIASLLANSFQMKGSNNFQTLLPSYGDDIQMKGGGHNASGPGGMFTKEVKMELEGQNRSMNHHWSAPSQNQMDHNMGSSSDPSVMWGNGPNLGAWLDPSNNLGSSVPSLI